MNDTYIPREHLLHASNGSIYSLVILVAKRALQLADGKAALLENPSEKVLENSFREVLAGKVKVKTVEQE